jgi:4a-hydroxytetrahydrobiopterin dehydratase
MLKQLSADEIAAGLAALPGWTLEGGKLYREFKFPDFPRAFGFMTSIAIAAQQMDHHPEWLNVYATVKVWLTTHDVQGISARDLALAQIMNDHYQKA